jgi:hypothetical protein
MNKSGSSSDPVNNESIVSFKSTNSLLKIKKSRMGENSALDKKKLSISIIKDQKLNTTKDSKNDEKTLIDLFVTPIDTKTNGITNKFTPEILADQNNSQSKESTVNEESNYQQEIDLSASMQDFSQSSSKK